MATQTSIRLTYEDYAAIPNDGRRHENEVRLNDDMHTQTKVQRRM